MHKYTVKISLVASTLSERSAPLDESPAPLSHGWFNDQAWEVVAAQRKTLSPYASEERTFFAAEYL